MDKSFKKFSILLMSACTIVFLSNANIVEARPFVWNNKQIPRMSPVSSDYFIMGNAVATKEQCVKYLLKNNPKPALSVSPQQLVEYYYEEGSREGIKPDIAFAQALHETGYFRYGGSVEARQNNFCGLGTVGGGMRGAWFPNSQIGVRAHIQHILAYASTKRPSTNIVDPRYRLVTTTRNFGQARTWTDLDGKWAVPGYGYGEKILKIHQDILEEQR